jgi:hypothetical protein
MTAATLREAKEQLARLAIGDVPTKQIAKRAAQMVRWYWGELSAGERLELRHWLKAVHAHSARIAERAVMNEKIRQAEMAIGALEALTNLESKAPKQG